MKKFPNGSVEEISLFLGNPLIAANSLFQSSKEKWVCRSKNNATLFEMIKKIKSYMIKN